MLLDRIEDRIAHFPGKIGIYYVDLSDGQRCFCGNCDVFPASGMVKLLLLLGLFYEREQGNLSEQERIILNEKTCPENEDPATVNGGMHYGILRYLDSGLKLTVKDLYHIMMIISDNAAFNILLDRVGISNANRTLKELGFKKSRINRKIRVGKVHDGVENLISIGELVSFFEKLYNRQIISDEASRDIDKLLKEHQRTNIMPYYFFEDLPIAHHTGFDEELLLAAGIVYTEYPFILCMAANEADTRNSENMMRDVTMLCYENSIDINR